MTKKIISFISLILFWGITIYNLFATNYSRLFSNSPYTNWFSYFLGWFFWVIVFALPCYYSLRYLTNSWKTRSEIKVDEKIDKSEIINTDTITLSETETKTTYKLSKIQKKILQAFCFFLILTVIVILIRI